MPVQQLKVVRLGELLVNAGAITQEILDAAIEEQKSSKLRLGELLIKDGYVTENHLAEALSQQLALPQVTFAEMRPQPEALSLVPENVAERLNVLPLALEGDGVIVVAMSDPMDTYAVDELYLLTKRDLEIRVATPTDIRKAIVNYYRVQSSVKDAMTDILKQEAAIRGGDSVETVDEKRGEDVSDIAADAAPVVRLVNSVLEQAVREKVSDIHIEPEEKLTRVRFRIDGSLFTNIEVPSNLHAPLVARIKILSGMDIAEKRRPQDGRILIRVAGSRMDLRVSTLPSVLGEKVVLRLLDQGGSKVGLDKLGFREQQQKALTDAIHASNGIILVTGPTGSGKSTTLYSLLDLLNDPKKNIITLEDPVEFSISGLTQVQIQERIGFTFGSALRSVLRQDPDIVMVGEIRDTETAQLAVRAALTGHLVLSTLHTNDAPTAINRLVDMGVARFLLASSIRAVLAQRLVKSLCTHCKEKTTVNAEMSEASGIPEGTEIYMPKGCPECRQTGYKGRTVIAEIMSVDKTMRTMINDGATELEMREYASKFGMYSLREEARFKVEAGITGVNDMLYATMMD